MLIDGLNLAEGSSAQNFTISSGSSFPLIAAEGEAFYRNDGANEGLYLYDGASWIQAGGFDDTASRNITGLYSFTQPVSGAAPVSASDLTTKQYVDNIATGLDVKLSVKAATTANITLTGTQTIDGVAVVSGDRVLVKDQSTGSQNGLYVVSAGAWTRSTDADNSPVGEVTSGMFTLVTSGTANANKGFVLTSADPIILGTTALTFAQFSGGGAVAPTLTSTQVGFGSGTNTLTGSTKFTWIDASNALRLGDGATSSFTVHPTIGNGSGVVGSALYIQGGAGFGAGAGTAGGAGGGNLFLKGGQAGAAGAGGDVNISGGQPFAGTGGSVNITAGGSITNPGNVVIQGGNIPNSNVVVAGYAALYGGNTGSAAGQTGGAAYVSGGYSGGGKGGHAYVSGGGSNSNTAGDFGGSVIISGGINSSYSVTGGPIIFNTAPTNTLIERLRILANGAWSVGTGGVAYGTAGQVLTSNGNAAPTWSAVGAAAAGSLTGNTLASGTIYSSLQTVGTLITLSVLGQTSASPGNMTIQGGTTNLNTTGKGGSVLLTGGAGNGIDSRSGDVILTGGNGNQPGARGGDVNLVGGGSSSNSSYPGNTKVIGGSSAYASGGTATIEGGTGITNQHGGDVIIKGGTPGTVSAAGQKGGDVVISGGPAGLGTFGVIYLNTAATERLRILASGAWSVGTGGTATGTSGQVLTSTGGTTAPTWSTAQTVGSPAPATTATTGFAYIPVSTGTPTGVPTAITGYAPMVADSGGSKLWVYIGGAWKSVTLA